jgi:hypothetical protein
MKKSNQTRGASVGMFYLYTILIITAVLILCSCGSMPQEQKAFNTVQWENSIWNPANAEFIDEVAFNEDVASSSVTQQMFDARYSAGY